MKVTATVFFRGDDEWRAFTVEECTAD